MKTLWMKKGYDGSGGYHGTYHCENTDCPNDRKHFSRSKGWFVMLTPDAFDNRFAEIHGYCSKKCAIEAQAVQEPEEEKSRKLPEKNVL